MLRKEEYHGRTENVIIYVKTEEIQDGNHHIHSS